MRVCSSFFFFNDPPPTEIYTLSLHDALPICDLRPLALHEAPREPLDPGRRPALDDQIKDGRDLRGPGGDVDDASVLDDADALAPTVQKVLAEFHVRCLLG